MNRLETIRQGYTAIGNGNYKTGRNMARRGADHEIDLDVVEEIGNVANSIGDIAARTYAAAIIFPYTSDLSFDLTRLGPWSWSVDVWSDDDSTELLDLLAKESLDYGHTAT